MSLTSSWSLEVLRRFKIVDLDLVTVVTTDRSNVMHFEDSIPSVFEWTPQVDDRGQQKNANGQQEEVCAILRILRPG